MENTQNTNTIAQRLLQEYMADDAGLLVIGGRNVPGKGIENNAVFKVSSVDSYIAMASTISRYPKLIPEIKQILVIAEKMIELKNGGATPPPTNLN